MTMGQFTRMRVATLALAAVAWAAAVGPLGAQTVPTTGQQAPSISANGTAVSVTTAELSQIRLALSQPAVLKLDERQLRFYLEVMARQPVRFSVQDFFKGYDLVNGPVKRGSPMSHQEFVSMVTPKELYSSAGITAIESLQFALTNWLSQSLLKKALEDVREAKTDREVQEIRERIDRELEALRGGGK